MQRSAPLWVPFVPYAITSLVHVVILFADLPGAGITKLLLMPLLALGALWASTAMRPYPATPILVLLLAIIASWWGDAAGVFIPDSDVELPMMLGCFGLAHLLYMWLFWRTPGLMVRRFPVWALGFTIWWIVLVFVIGPHTDGLLIPVMLYGVVLAGTAAFASRCGPLIAWGGLWFLVSDTILAFRIFLPDDMPAWTGAAVMATYTLGQGLIGYGTVRVLHEGRQRSGSLDG